MNVLFESLMPHVMIAPVAIPMGTAAVMVLLPEPWRRLRLALNIGAMSLVLMIALGLAAWVHLRGPVVYVSGGWPPPFGIALVLDRLSALMLMLAAFVGVCATTFAATRWSRAGVHFNPLVQLQLMGLCGAFLTADLFNLFVFFEILLAASYGLLLHGSGGARVRAGLHYIAVNLAASSLFLLGTSTLYGLTGTLNLADLAGRIGLVPAADQGVLHVAMALLALAFIVKAALWPLNLWLVPAYSAATPPAAAFFALLTKVGVYALLRCSTLFFSQGAPPAVGDVLMLFGLVTAVLGAAGMLASQRLAPLAAFSLVSSSGTLVAALGFTDVGVTAGALVYLVSSTLTAGAFFLLVDLIDRWRNSNATLEDEAPFLTASLIADEGVNLDDEQQLLIARPFPAQTAFLGLCFLACAVLSAGLPPLSGFIGKLAMLSASLEAPRGPARAWLFIAVSLGVGLLALVAGVRAGIRHFWAGDREPPTLRFTEGVPLLVLLLACAGLTMLAGPALDYAQLTAKALYAPDGYVDAVLHPAKERP